MLVPRLQPGGGWTPGTILVSYLVSYAQRPKVQDNLNRSKKTQTTMAKQQSSRTKKAVKNYGCQVILYWPEPKQNQDPAMAIFGIL